MNKILIGKNDSATVELDSRYGNRHGMIAGATGTGKSVSLMVMAEGFSRMGVPSVVADVKGDIAGMSQAADPPGEKLQKRFDTQIGRASCRERVSLQKIVLSDKKDDQ